MSEQTATAKERRDALSLAYQVLTDEHNLRKYSMCGIRDTKTMELFEYGDMLRVLRVMHGEVTKQLKKVKADE